MTAIEFVGGAIAVLVLLGLTGRLVQAWGSRRDRRRYPPLGEMVAVGRHRLHLHRLDLRPPGASPSTPTVVFEAALGGSSLGWWLVQREVAKFAPTVSYDRAGMGFSEAGPMPRSFDQCLRELRGLLEAAAIPAPVILVGHSYPGLFTKGARGGEKRHGGPAAALQRARTSGRTTGDDIRRRDIGV